MKIKKIIGGLILLVVIGGGFIFLAEAMGYIETLKMLGLAVGISVLLGVGVVFLLDEDDD